MRIDFLTFVSWFYIITLIIIIYTFIKIGADVYFDQCTVTTVPDECSFTAEGRPVALQACACLCACTSDVINLTFDVFSM